MAKILVTGGCGYIGSHTIIDLIENGFDVDPEDLSKDLDKLIAEKARERSSQTQHKFVEVRTTPKIGRNEPCTCINPAH